MKDKKLKLIVNNQELIATLYNNSSVDALLSRLKEGPITINMSDYANMEKVGNLGFSLPRNDASIKTQAGDLILYQGNSFVIYYDTNSWSGKLDNINENDLRTLLGTGDIIVTISLVD